MQGELIHGKVPKGIGGRRASRRLFRVLVAAIVSQPDIVTLFKKLKRQTTFPLGNTHPDLAVHQQAMMQIHDLLSNTALTSIDSRPLFSPSIT